MRRSGKAHSPSLVISEGLSSATSTALEEALRRISDEAARAAAQARDQTQAAMQPLLDSMREMAASIRDQAAKGSGELVDGGKSAEACLRRPQRTSPTASELRRLMQQQRRPQLRRWLPTWKRPSASSSSSNARSQGTLAICSGRGHRSTLRERYSELLPTNSGRSRRRCRRRSRRSKRQPGRPRTSSKPPCRPRTASRTPPPSSPRCHGTPLRLSSNTGTGLPRPIRNWQRRSRPS